MPKLKNPNPQHPRISQLHREYEKIDRLTVLPDGAIQDGNKKTTLRATLPAIHRKAQIMARKMIGGETTGCQCDRLADLIEACHLACMHLENGRWDLANGTLCALDEPGSFFVPSDARAMQAKLDARADARSTVQLFRGAGADCDSCPKGPDGWWRYIPLGELALDLSIVRLTLHKPRFAYPLLNLSSVLVFASKKVAEKRQTGGVV